MENIPAVAFSAWSGTGKTTLIEKLIVELKKRGMRVAVIKHDGHDFEIDREGKDSWRFTKAGADVSIISSAEKTALVELGNQSLSRLLKRIDNVDVVLVEGYKNEQLPRIGVARKATGKGFVGGTEQYVALVSDTEIETGHPHFGLDDIAEIADFIMEILGMKEFTHFNDEGRARMVDVGEKSLTRRSATAAARVNVNEATFALIKSGGMKKGDVLTVAQIAGVMGAKRTPELIPMCHPIIIDGIDMKLRLDEERCSVELEATVSCDGRTGVEMEALTAVSTAALTVYDMCKAVQKDIIISDIRLVKKSGGVHGDYERKDD